MSSLARSAVIFFDWNSLRVRRLNAAARMLGGTRSWIGRPLHECLASAGSAAAGPPIDRNKLREHARAGSAFAFRIGDAIWRAEVSPLSCGPASDGDDASGVLLLREAGKAEDYRDFALERIDALHALAHDLRTPLNAMLGWLHLMSMPQSGPGVNARALHGLRQAVEQQQRLLADWLERAGDDRSEIDPAYAGEAASSEQNPATQGRAGSAPRPSRRPRFTQAPPGQTADGTPGAADAVSLGDRSPATGARFADRAAPIDGAASVNGVHSGAAGGGTVAAGQPGGAGNDLSGVFILAVDDRPELLEVLTQVLAADGASIETTTSADDALARYPAWAASGGERLLVSDLAMPGRDGFSLIREIRALERNRHMPRLPAVALSAHGLPDVRRRAIENGFDLFVDKPVDPRVLLGRLHRLLDR